MQANISDNSVIDLAYNNPSELIEAIGLLSFSDKKNLLGIKDNYGKIALHILAELHAEKLLEILKPLSFPEQQELLETRGDSDKTVLHVLAKYHPDKLPEFLKPHDFSKQKELLKMKSGKYGNTVLHTLAHYRPGSLLVALKHYTPAERDELLMFENNNGKNVKLWSIREPSTMARFTKSFFKLSLGMAAFTLKRLFLNLARALKPYREDKYYYGKTSNEANRRYYGDSVGDFRHENIALLNFYGKLEYVLDAVFGAMVYPTRRLATLIFGKRDPMQKAIKVLLNDMHSQSDDSDTCESTAKMLQALGDPVKATQSKLTPEEEASYKAVFERHPKAVQKIEKYITRGITPAA